jgi:hypothetical protein
LARRRKLRAVLWGLAITITLVVLYIIVDALRTKSIIKESTGNVTQTLGEAIQKNIFDEKLFTFETPVGWEKVDPPDRIKEYTDLTYRRLKDGLTLQEMYIVMNENIPKDYELTYVLPIEISESNTIQPFDVSPKCNELADKPSSRQSQIVSWAGVEFMCDPDRGSYIVGTSHYKFGYSTQLAGSSSVNQYFFIFLDYQPTPQFTNFQNILRTVRTK